MAENTDVIPDSGKDMNNDPGMDTGMYELNQHPNSAVYEEQQRSAAAVNGSGTIQDKTAARGWKIFWFMKK